MPADAEGCTVCCSRSAGWGSCKLLLLDVSMYLPNNLSKVFQDILPFQSLLDSLFIQLVASLHDSPFSRLGNSSQPTPSPCASPGGVLQAACSALRGAQ